MSKEEIKTENDVDFQVVTHENPDDFRKEMIHYLDLGYGITNSFYIERTGMMPLYIAYLAKAGNIGEIMGVAFRNMREAMNMPSDDLR